MRDDTPSADDLLNYAERPRTDDWSLRSSLVRFAQAEPVRAGAVLELVRRCDYALHLAQKTKEDDALTAPMAVATRLDALGDLLTTWAANAQTPPPVDEVDKVSKAVFVEMDELGISHNTGPPFSGRRGRST